MSNFAVDYNKSTIQFESHLEKLKEPTKTLMIDLRNFVKSLGDNVIEEVRPHRVIYSKGLTFRIFLDIQPMKDSLIISIRLGRNKPSMIQTIKTPQDLQNIKKEIVTAYKTIQ
jgi:Domain of unknown function (DUF5655)